MNVSSTIRAIRNRLRRPSCGACHWHVDRGGWYCCWCPSVCKATAAAPEHGRQECAQPAVEDSPLAWLTAVPAHPTLVPRPARKPRARR